MKCLLQISLPFLLSWRYFLSSSPIKGHRFCWKNLCHFLEGSPYLITKKRASSYPLMFAKGKKKFFFHFSMGTQYSPHPLPSSHNIPNQKDPRRALILLLSSSSWRLNLLGSVHRSWIHIIAKIFDWWLIDQISNYNSFFPPLLPDFP